MSWRPEGWKNKYQRELDILTEGAGIQLSDSIGNLHDKSCIFEAGADALLEAQKKEGRYFVGGSNLVSEGNIDVYFDVEQGGWLVFIPEEKDENTNMV